MSGAYYHGLARWKRENGDGTQMSRIRASCAKRTGPRVAMAGVGEIKLSFKNLLTLIILDKKLSG